MNGKVPHIVQYQGSKRILAPKILRYMSKSFDRLIEPFSGMAAITMAVAHERRANRYHINDLNAPLVNLLQCAIEEPSDLIENYKSVWEQQFNFSDGHIEHFNHIRSDFNDGNQSPENMLYLLARCVKGAVRYGKSGNFNQSPDKRRHGTNPKNIEKNVYAISCLLKGNTSFSVTDYREIFDMARQGDLVYMDPPYQGVSNVRDNRYFSGVDFKEFADAIETLNRKNVDYLISYDGECGGKEYGKELPKQLNCNKILLNAGISTQATLLGKRHITYESLYISKNLSKCIDTLPEQLTLLDGFV
ncbi:site-specific DNA-methyltransferase (adenine-specific) [Gammaproteobacteria bacterium]|nr:site-specific DNA-methyltransferase (adenine-specific) [Gammaproteobacteria bacterium]